MQTKLRKKAELYDSFAESREKALAKWAYTDPQWRAGRLFDTLMALKASQHVEIGCGAGLLAGRFIQHGVSLFWPDYLVGQERLYTGVDISSAMLKLTREAGAKVLVRAAAEQLPFADKSIECVVCDCTIQACAVPEAAMREIARVARSWLVASWINQERVGAMMERVMRKSGFYITEYHTYRRWPKPETYMHYQVYVGERRDAS